MNILGKGKRPVSVSYFTMPDVADVTIEIDASTATSRLNSDGNYYTITFPDDFIGTRGTADDPFKDVRIGTGAISKPASTSELAALHGRPSPKLNVILNIPAGMRIGANTANNIVPLGAWPYELITTDPSLYFNLNVSDWTPDILTRLNVTVNNYGVLLGAGGSGGWGGMKYVDTGGKGAVVTRDGQGGAGSGQGLHPAYGTSTLGDYYDPNDPTPLPAGSAGSGYRWWPINDINGNPVATSPVKSANGQHGTPEDGGAAGAGNGDSGDVAMLLASAVSGEGHYGGSVIYYDSDVASPTTGTHITLYNEGWMSAGCGGGSGTVNDLYGGSGAGVGTVQDLTAITKLRVGYQEAFLGNSLKRQWAPIFQYQTM